MSYTDDGTTAESPTSAPTATVTNVNDAGVASITGTAAEGQTLTAGISDADGISGVISYQWKSGGTNVGANADQYVLVQGDVGNTITVTVSYTDDGSTAESPTSAPTATVTNVNDAPTGNVTISGLTTEGKTLTANSSLADADGLGTISYQWKRNGAIIGGGTLSTYDLVQADVGKAITVSASYTDLQGTPESVTSSPTALIANVNDAPTGSVTISGLATEGKTLTASNTLADSDGLGTISYQWKRNTDVISGATSATYLLKQADVGTAITVSANYTDLQGTPESVTSSPTALIANVNDEPTGNVTIAGIKTEGQTLTASNTLADADGLGTISYQWKRNGAIIGGGTLSTYDLVQADVGKAITVSANYTDLQGTPESVTSSPTALIANVDNAPTGSVTISGLATEGETLTASNTLADIDGLGTISYQWKRAGSDIVGATLTTYDLVQADVGKVITVTASYTDLEGTPESVTSNPTALIANVNDLGVSTIIGSSIRDQGETLTANVTDADGLPVIINYQWKRNGAAIGGGTLSTYELVQADVGKAITVTASYTDLQGTPESPTSAQVAVLNINDAGSVTISGTLMQGQTLSVTVTDADGTPASINYQWRRNGSVFLSTISSTYVLVEADNGKAISVTASYTDLQGTPESVTSSPTAIVGNVNDEPTGNVTIAGIKTEGQTLTASNTLADADGLGAISYQWKRNTDVISGATSATYLLKQADVGTAITVSANYTDLQGTPESVTSSPTALIANVNDEPTGNVTIAGIKTEGQTLTASNTLADADGLGTISYQWKRNGAIIGGATLSTYDLVQADVGKAITVTCELYRFTRYARKCHE